MKKFYKLIGSAFLGIAALITIVGPVSLNLIAVEEIPESMKLTR
ncbi:hypothetical protein [Candidatus Clostridium radicumherbarum]|uniref:Cyclic lactone autoinducer peptide n=1 Tax=Candidatus Clostridium radicumherbarum TaxID=3381662 RepID=A0ABW8TRA3_9CLOT